MLGELEVAVYITSAERGRRPVTSSMRRALLRRGLQRERLGLVKAGRTRVRALVEGIEEGKLRVLASKEQASWGRHESEPDAVGHILGYALETGRDVAGRRTRCGRGQRAAVGATAPWAQGQCVWCGLDDGRDYPLHAIHCSEWRHEVRQAEWADA